MREKIYTGHLGGGVESCAITRVLCSQYMVDFTIAKAEQTRPKSQDPVR